MGEEELGRTLLVVDDKPAVLRAVSRVIAKKFDTVLTAETPEQAEAHLAANTVTHLMCDHDLGKGKPKGTDLIPKWRTEHPSITRAVLFSATAPSKITVPPEADVFLPKPLGAKALFEGLGV